MIDYYIIIFVFLIALAINLTFFIISFIVKTDIFTDITYCGSFIILSIIIVIGKQNFSPVQICLFILYNIGALRLGSYLLIRILKTKTDHRFDKLRNNFGKLAMFGFIQTISVTIISMPTIFALSLKASYFNAKFNYYLIIFISLAILFLVIETIADFQKFFFHMKEHKKNAFINYGFGKDSRHPNYLGEIGFGYMMTGLFLTDLLLKNVTSNNLNDLGQLLGIISPFFLNILLLKVSGITLLEIKAQAKLGKTEDYQIYLKNTSCLIFYIGKKGPINKVKKLNKKII